MWNQILLNVYFAGFNKGKLFEINKILGFKEKKEKCKLLNIQLDRFIYLFHTYTNTRKLYTAALDLKNFSEKSIMS